MKEQIKQTLKRLKRSYALFWGAALLLFLLGETETFPVGVYAGHIREAYIIETVGIVLTAVCIPLSLKLFNWMLTCKLDHMDTMGALGRYRLWSNIRLLLLEAVVFVNLLSYFWTLSNTGGLCALMALTASLFCIPGEKRLRADLHLEEKV